MQNRYAVINDVAKEIYVRLISEIALKGLADPSNAKSYAESAYALATAFADVAGNEKGNEQKFQLVTSE